MVSGRQISDRTEAWLYVGALVHLVLLAAFGIASITSPIWGPRISVNALDHDVRAYGWIVVWLLTGTCICVRAFVRRAPNRRFRPALAAKEAMLVIVGRLPPVTSERGSRGGSAKVDA